ncbi:hypothetical protein [Planctomycetes bacterium CA13]|uniref:hypothetical protein n=1 Tax=Novipirellula herctigrandis TaxID=2527986 RepID=UPI0011B5FFF1
MSGFLGAAFFSVLGLFACANASAEIWTDLRGRYEVEADLLGVWENNAILRMPDGRRVSVELNNLRSESRIQAQNLAKKRQTQQAEFVREIEKQVEIANLAAPDPLPQPKKVATYQPLEEGAEPLAALEHTASQVAAGHELLARYDALPTKYREDIDALVKLAAAKPDAATLQSTLTSFSELGSFVESHQNWIFDHPRLQTLDEGTRETVRELVLGIAGIMKTAFAPEALNLNELKSSPFRDWLVAQDASIAPYMKQVYNIADSTTMSFEEAGPQEQVTNPATIYGPTRGYGGDPSGYGYEDMYGSSDYGDDSGYGYEDMYGDDSGYGDGSGSGYGSSGPPPGYMPEGYGSGPGGPGGEPAPKKEITEFKAKTQVNGKPFVFQLTRIDGYWVEKKMSENWDENIESLKKQIEDGTLLNVSVMQGLSTMIAPSVSNLKSAETKEDFYRMLKAEMASFSSMTSMLAPMIQGPNAGRNNGGSDPYGSGGSPYGPGGNPYGPSGSPYGPGGNPYGPGGNPSGPGGSSSGPGGSSSGSGVSPYGPGSSSFGQGYDPNGSRNRP